MKPIRVEIRGTALKVALVVASVALCVAVSAVSVRTVRAARKGAALTEASLQAAAALEPGNAARQDTLGRYMLYGDLSADRALAHLKRATELNPHESSYWLDLASAYQVSGDSAGQKNAILRALAADPTTPRVLWEAANFYTVEGDTANALLTFRAVVRHDPSLAGQAFSICWRATHDIDLILKEVAPSTPAAMLDLLNLMVAEKQTDATKKVWKRLTAMNEQVEAASLFPYVDYLVGAHEAQEAAKVWKEMARLDDKVKNALPGEDLVVNGSFENAILNGGFDWRYLEQTAVAVSVDSTTFAAGTRSITAKVDRVRLETFGMWQYVVLKPNTNYNFKGQLRTEELTTASGPRFIVRDAYSNKVLLMTDDQLATNVWSQYAQEFTTGPDTTLATVTVGRDPSESVIQGKIWFDDISIREKR